MGEGGCRPFGIDKKLNTMKVLMISTDAQIFNEGSAVRERIKEYGNLVDELHVIVFALKSPHVEKGQFGKLFLYPTNSYSKLSFVHDAKKIGNEVLLQAREKDGLKNLAITVQDPFETAIVGMFLKKKFSIPLQIQVHTDFLSPYFWRQSVKNAIRRFCLGIRFLKKADGIRVVSERIKKSLLKRGIADTKIIVLPVFFDRERFLSAEPNKEYPGEFLILTVARLESEKNLPLAIDVAANVIHQYPKKKIRYVIIGSGRDEPKLIKRIKRLGMQDRIAIQQANSADLPGWYKRADLFLLTSNYEGYGMAAAEAMAAGTPVVMTDVGLAGEILENGKSGLVFPVGNQEVLRDILIKILDGPQSTEKFRIEAREAVKRLPTRQDYLSALRSSWESLLR